MNFPWVLPLLSLLDICSCTEPSYLRLRNFADLFCWLNDFSSASGCHQEGLRGHTADEFGKIPATCHSATAWEAIKTAQVWEVPYLPIDPQDRVKTVAARLFLDNCSAVCRRHYQTILTKPLWIEADFVQARVHEINPLPRNCWEA